MSWETSLILPLLRAFLVFFVFFNLFLPVPTKTISSIDSYLISIAKEKAQHITLFLSHIHIRILPHYCTAIQRHLPELV
jgi:hypothetical protein